MFLMEFSLCFFYLVRLDDADQVKINWRGELFSLALENPATQKSVNYFAIYSMYGYKNSLEFDSIGGSAQYLG